MSVVENGCVDGYALVTDLLAGVGLRADQVSRIEIGVGNVVIDYYLHNDEGRIYSTCGEVATARLSLPIDWSDK